MLKPLKPLKVIHTCSQYTVFRQTSGRGPGYVSSQRRVALAGTGVVLRPHESRRVLPAAFWRNIFDFACDRVHAILPCSDSSQIKRSQHPTCYTTRCLALKACDPIDQHVYINGSMPTGLFSVLALSLDSALCGSQAASIKHVPCAQMPTLSTGPAATPAPVPSREVHQA